MAAGAESSLVTYVDWTKKYSSSNQKKTKITIHHMAGKMTAKQCIDLLKNSNRSASCQYAIGYDGGIAQAVHEKDRAWTSSSSWNDSRAITIEVSNSDCKEPWPISDAAYKALIELCADICVRNGITAVTYDGTKNAVLTEHRMFAATACPGTTIHNWLVSGKIAQDINARLGSAAEITPEATDGSFVYQELDYTPVFNPVYYSSRYPDLGAAGLRSDMQLFQHFILKGMSEARQAHPDFDPKKYRDVEKDVELAIGDDWEGYYKHYLLLGKDEIARGDRAPFM